MKAIDILDRVICMCETEQSGIYFFAPFEGENAEDELERMFGMLAYTGVMRKGARYFYTYNESFCDELNKISVFDVEIVSKYDDKIWLWRIDD